MDLIAKLNWHNAMILLSEEEIDKTQTLLPCKKVLALTPWKRQRDEILYSFLSQFDKQNKPILIFANSVVEVNLITASLRSQFPNLDEAAVKAIGTNVSVTVLKTELPNYQQYNYLILSSQMSLAAFVHGLIKIQDFSLLCFADARGANQNHPFCVIMNNFYTPLRHESFKPRVVGFSELKSLKDIEVDMFSRRDWIKTLKHFTHTFHSVPLPVGPDVVTNFLESLDNSILFDPLSIYETTAIEPSEKYPIVTSVNFNLDADLGADTIVLKYETDDPSCLYEFLKAAKEVKDIKRVIHVQSNPKFSARLSLFVAMKNLKLAAEAPSNSLDPEIASNLTKDASTLFSQSEHVLSIKGIERIIRNPKTESLLIESTAIPVLVRCCTMLARQFRQSSSNETIKFKTIRVFPLNSEGQKISTYFNHLSLLKLPIFFHEKIKMAIKTPATIDTDQFHIQGPVVQSRHQAQCCVAFEAAKLLISAGILDDNLMLAEEFRKEESEDTEITEINPDDMETVVDDNPCINNISTCTMSFNEIIPRTLLKGPKLFIYALEYELKMYGTPEDPLALEPEPVLLTPFSRLLLAATPSIDFFSVSKSNRTWSLLLPSQLPSTFVPVEIPIGADHFLKTTLKFIDEMDCVSQEYEELLRMQQCLFGMFNMKPFTVPDNENLINDQPSVDLVPGDKQPFYLIAPLTNTLTSADELTDFKDIPRVWDLFKSFVKSFKAAPLEGTLYSPIEAVKRDLDWKIDWDLLRRLNDKSALNLSVYIEELEKYPTDLSIQLEEGGVLIDFKRFALERLAFYTPHTKIFYRPSRPIPEPIYPSSPFSSPAYPHVTTHAEYVRARYDLNVEEMEKEMLAVKRVENWSDLAVWISDDGASKKRRKKSSTTSNSTGISPGTSLIIPELTRVFPASYSTFRAAMLLPRVSFEIERQLRIAQFFEDRLPAPLPKPKHLRQVEAMTASTAALSYSYEQLEVLGDSFLKYYSTLDTLLVGAGWSEGRLSSHRQRILCNATLRKAAENLNLTSYASFTPFFAKLWCPPALIASLPAPSNALNSALDHVLFAPEERWKALASVEGKQVQKQVVYLLDTEGRLSIDENYKTKEQAKNSTDAIYKYGQLIPPKSLADIIESLIGIYYIDSGVQGALQFLVFCGILKTEIFRVRELDPLKLILGDGRIGQEEQLEKLKRRKITPMTNIILSAQGVDNENENVTFSELIKETQSLVAPVGQKIDNVQPHVPSFASFPFPALETALNYSFNHLELAFMACTHTSADLKLNGEKLEWIGDAAIDWIVCRHYWYNYRLKPEDVDENENESTIDNNACSNDSNPCTPNTLALAHPSVSHVPKGHLPLTPESLTNSRQSAINNEAFARLVIKNNLHQFLRINSPHLQIEIERFADDFLKQNRTQNFNNLNTNINLFTPEALEGLQTHVSVAAPKVLGDLFESLMGAVLLDTNFDIELFSTLFTPFLKTICPDPSSLPTNAIQETLHLYARLGIPRHQIVCTYKSISDTDQFLGVICQVWVRERCVAEAEGSNKLVAKKLAMEKALNELMNNPSDYT